MTLRPLVTVLLVVQTAVSCTAPAPPAAPTPPAPQTPAAAPTSPGSPAPPTQPLPTPAGPAPTPASSPLASLVGEIRSSAVREPLSAATEAERAALVAADTEFGLDLYRQLALNETDDFIFSPYSISTALSMTYAGARGRTADELATALGIGVDHATWHAARNRLELELAALAEYDFPGEGDAVPLTLEPVNTIFGQRGYPFEEEFLDVLARSYGAGMQVVDFGATEAARQAINDWVADKTRDRIEEIIGPDHIDPLTRFVLVNAIYMKANWILPFDPEATRSAPFHLLDGTPVDVPMMHSSLKQQYSSGDGWQAVELPYFGASMIVLVPDRGRFAEVEERLDADFLADLGRNLEEAEVVLGLPRWESENSVDLEAHLKALGVIDLFEPYVADLTGVTAIARQDGLHISYALHEASITVNEDGTEAAAATAVIGQAVSGPPRTVTLTVDRPFIYLIKDQTAGELLFLGRVLSP